MRPVRRSRVPYSFSVHRAGGRRQRSRYLRRHPYQSQFRRRRPPSAAPRPAAASSSRGDTGQSSVRSEDRNAMQNPQEVFPHEDRGGSSDFPTLSSESSQDSSTVRIEINLEDSEDERELVIDMSPQAVVEDPRMNREYTNVMRDGAICEEESGGSVTGRDLGDGEEESEGKPGNTSPKANEIYLHDVKTDTLKAVEEGGAHASAVGKCASSAAFIEADTQKEILKQEKAESSRLVKAIAQEHTTEDHVRSGKQYVSIGKHSIWCTGHSSKDETASKRPCKEIINAEEGQSNKENGVNDSPKESYPCPTYLNTKGSKTILQSSSVEELASSKEDSELSDSDDSVEECRRIFDEFERELQKKNSELQACGQNADLNVLETESSIPGQKTRITHAGESQDHDAAIQQGHRRATEFALGVKRGEGFVTTTNERTTATSTFSDAQFQSTGPVGQSSVRSEDRNAMQNPQEVFPHEDRGGSSDFPTLSGERSQDSSTVRIEISLEDSEDERELVIDMSPQAVDEDPRMNREYTNVMRDGAICEEESGGSVTGRDLGDGEEESEGKPGNASPKANEIYLHDVKTDTLKAVEEGGAHASAVGKCASSAAFIEADTQKEILKQEKAESSRLVKAIAQEHTTEDRVKSGKQYVSIGKHSVWCTGHSSKDETASKRPCKEIINAEEGQSNKENGVNDSPKESYPCPTYLNTKGSKTILQSSSVEELASSKEDSELSDSDDSVEECRRIFDEFERELQKKNSELQACGQNADLNVLETESSIPGQKTRITHAGESQDHDAAIQQGHRRATEFALGVKRGEGFVTITNERTTAPSTFSDAQFQSTGPVVPPNVVKTSKCQLYFHWTGNTVMEISDVRNISDVPNKIFIQKRLFMSESGFKVPLETRQRYISLFLAECFKICSTSGEAVNKAVIEEQRIYDRCGNKKMYLSFAVKTLKKLRDHGQLRNIRSEAGSMMPGEKEAFTGCALYELLKSYLLTEEQLNEYNFPRPSPEKKGDALFSRHTKSACHDASRRVCCRCGTIYSVLSSSEDKCQEECNYHSGIVLERKVPGGMEKRYSCCEELVGSPGCQYAKCHVHDGRQEKLEAFMKTFDKPPPFDGYYGVYALDCEMCYTTRGLEVTRVTVVDTKLQVVYDTLVKPGGEVVDCDTRLSGVTEDNLKNTTTSILEVQAVLLHLFNVNTILIGHELENDLFVLKLIHDMIVDTSVVFPHPLGFPHKRALKSLMADNLRKIHGDDVEGYNSKEDAIACMELILWKIKESNKRKNS